MKEELQKVISEIASELAGESVVAEVTTPTDSAHGDYTTNVAFVLSKKLGKSPREVAELVVEKLKQYSSNGFGELTVNSERSSHLVRTIQSITVAGNGFINFTLSNDELISRVSEVLGSEEKIVGVGQIMPYKKVIVEYSSPNIAKPFTIGHLRSTIIGDAVANILTAVGCEVYRDNHLGDWGTQFGKQIYAIKTWGSEEAIEKSDNPIKELVALYIKFHEEAEKNPELDEEGRKWFKRLEDGDPEARRLWQKCIEWSFKEFDRIYGELGVKITENNGRGYGEAFFEDKMGVVLDELREKHLLTESKGAELIFYPNDTLPPLMILKNDGATLYGTRDLATDKFRLEHYGKDIQIIVEVGAEQILYQEQVAQAEILLGWYKKGQRRHLSHGHFKFKEGKMSTRKGNVIWLEDVLNEAKERALSFQSVGFKSESDEEVSIRFNKSARKHKPEGEDKANLAKKVAIGALKWNDLKRSPQLDVVFDWDEILNMQGNSGPYIQYTYVRTQSILGKAEAYGLWHIADNGVIPAKAGIYLSGSPIRSGMIEEKSFLAEDLPLLRKVYQFADVVEKAATDLAPSDVCTYLFELAQEFNTYYQKVRILEVLGGSTLDVENEEVQSSPTTYNLQPKTQSRLALTAAVGTILKQGLGLLGIEAPLRM